MRYIVVTNKAGSTKTDYIRTIQAASGPYNKDISSMNTWHQVDYSVWGSRIDYNLNLALSEAHPLFNIRVILVANQKLSMAATRLDTPFVRFAQRIKALTLPYFKKAAKVPSL